MTSDSRDLMRRWYANDYRSINASANGSVFERYTHRSMESQWGSSIFLPRVLEVGADRGQHFQYVRHGFGHYVMFDLTAPDLLPEVAQDPRIGCVVGDAANLPFPAQSFDRVVLTCVLHHVDSPLDVVLELRRVVRVGGILTILIPNDPGAAYRWGKALTTGRAARRAGRLAESRLADAIGHHNHFRSIRVQLLAAVAHDEVSTRWYPLRLASVEMNAFTVWDIKRLD